MSPSLFWTPRQILSRTGLLQYLYEENRVKKADVLYRAFKTTVTYLLLRSICAELEVTNFTTRARRYCSRLIMYQNNATDEKVRKRVEKNLIRDNKAGKIWYTYAAHLGGYGAFFLIGVAPKSLLGSRFWIF